MKQMHYQFVIFGSSSEFMRAAYADIDTYDGATYLYKNLETESKVKKALFRFHNSKKINSIMNLPYKSVWFNDLTPELNKHDYICFLFFAGGTRFNAIKDGYIEYLRDNYPNGRIVCFYQDLVSLKRNVSVQEIKEKCDLVLSFDQNDCYKYGLTYYPLVYSSSNIDVTDISNDVYFVGKAKDRLEDILDAYSFLRDSGLKCDFNIVGVDLREQKYPNEINYCEPMSYADNIKHILSSKSILEIMQQTGTGYTLRTCEAIANDRLLITNNAEVQQAPFYDPKLIITFDRPSKIDVGVVRNANIPVDYRYKQELSPIRLLQFIDSQL